LEEEIMRTLILVLFLTFAGTSALLFIFGQESRAQSGELPAARFVKADAASVERKEWNAVTVEVRPGAVQSWQFQPSGEVIYILEGTGRLEADGRPTVELHGGTVTTLGMTARHILKNTSRTKVLKVLVLSKVGKGGRHPLFLNRSSTPTGMSHLSLPKAETGPQVRDERSDRKDIGLVF
jgi:quercetin dioxygenase-like cupin family protein